MELKKLIERLPIVFRGKSEDYADEGEIPIIVFRESDYLALMNEAEQKPKKRAWDLGPVGGQSSDCVPPLREILCECEYGLQGEDHAKGCPEIAAVETSEKEWRKCNNPECGSHYGEPHSHLVDKPNGPFQGPYWPTEMPHFDNRWQEFFWSRTEDLRDELLRMRGGE